MDLDEILPAPPAINTDSFFGLEMDSDSSSLLLKENKPKVRIRDFPSWTCAWNLYVQAYLSAKPTMFYQLFSYAKIFATMARKFKFENCYAYDKAFRTQIAAEIDTPPTYRTTSWLRQNDDLYNMYLRDAYLPSCFHCYSYGHYIANCPFKTSKRVNPISSTTPAVASHNAQHGFWNNPYSYVANDTSTRGTLSTNFRNPSTNHTISTIPDQASSSNIVCGRYNRTGFCQKPPCRLSHVCNKCQRPGHPGNRCFSNTTSTFRP